MRLSSLAALLLLAGAPVLAEEPGRGKPGELVPACESLVALRQLSAGAGEDRARATAMVASQPGCRLVPLSRIGAVEQRAMVGGAPYECLTQASGGCIWVMP